MLKELVARVKPEPGALVWGQVDVSVRGDGSVISIPVAVVQGMTPGPVLCVDACIHGDEYEGFDIVHELLRRLDPKVMTGTLLAVPVVNLPAFEVRQRINPLDHFHYADLNRSFPGNDSGSITQRFAHAYLNNVVCHAQYVVSFHSGGNVFVLPPKVVLKLGDESDKTLGVAKALGWPILWESDSYPGTLGREASKRGLIAVGAEIGGGGDRTPERRYAVTDQGTRAVLGVMKHLDMLPGAPDFASQYVLVKGEGHLFSSSSGILEYARGLKFGQVVDEGTYLGRLIDVRGNEVDRFMAPYRGMIITMRTMPLVQPGEWVLGLGRDPQVV